MIDVLVSVFLFAGASFMFLAALGLVRFPDVLTRMHAAAKAGTLGKSCLAIGFMLYFGDVAFTTRAAMMVAFFVLSAPVGIHLIGRAAYAAGIAPWEGTVTDELRQHRDAGDRSARHAGEADEEPR